MRGQPLKVMRQIDVNLILRRAVRLQRGAQPFDRAESRRKRRFNEQQFGFQVERFRLRQFLRDRRNRKFSGRRVRPDERVALFRRP